MQTDYLAFLFRATFLIIPVYIYTFSLLVVVSSSRMTSELVSSCA